MLKRINRINKTRELQKVYRLGKALHTPALVIKFVPNKLPEAKIRMAFVVSKKVSKRAVERNRVKRVLRESMRSFLNQLAVGDYMVIAKSAAINFNNKELREQVATVLKKASLIS
jgi:ribonuclease P protein component